jgi:hypothetical protein
VKREKSKSRVREKRRGEEICILLAPKNNPVSTPATGLLNRDSSPKMALPKSRPNVKDAAAPPVRRPHRAVLRNKLEPCPIANGRAARMSSDGTWNQLVCRNPKSPP